MPIWLLVIGGGAMFLVITLVGGRELLLAYPQLKQRFHRLIASSRVNHSRIPAPRQRRARKVDQMVLCQVSRLALHHDRWFARMSNRRTAEPPIRTGSINDITDQRGYRPLTPKQIEWAEEMFTLNAHLPPDKQLSVNKLYPAFGGTMDKRKAELSEIKKRVDAKLQEQSNEQREVRLARLVSDIRPQRSTDTNEVEASSVGA